LFLIGHLILWFPAMPLMCGKAEPFRRNSHKFEATPHLATCKTPCLRLRRLMCGKA
jgi:hypothetical protein